MRRWALVGILALLAACGSDPNANADLKLIQAVLGGGLAKKPDAPAGKMVVPRAIIEAIGKPLLLASVSTGNASVFALLQTRGSLVTWGSSDGATLTFRDGILVSTRGLGSDLTSAAVPTLAELTNGSGSVRRIHYGYEGTDTEVPRTYTCQVSVLGTEALEVSELVFRVRRVAESCQSEGHEPFRNEYWIEYSGKMRQSRQWVGQNVGYVDLQLLSR